MPVHKLPLIMVSNVREKCQFQTQIFEKSPKATVGGGKPPPTSPSPRSVASLPRTAPVDKSWLHHALLLE